MYKDFNKKIVVTIEARMTSTRLPGKVMMLLAGKPALERFIERIKTSRYLDEIVIATTINKIDNNQIHSLLNGPVAHTGLKRLT